MSTTISYPNGFTPLEPSATSGALFGASNLFGTGADGNVTISSGTTTLTRDVSYNNLTINGTGAINTNGYRLFVAGTLDLSGAAAAAIFAAANGNGYTVIGGTGGRGSVAGSTGVGASGNQGYPAGTNNNQMVGGQSGASGAGGSGTNAGGSAASQSQSGVLYQFSYPQTQMPPFPSGSTGGSAANASFTSYAGGSGGGGGAGGGDGTNSGGNSQGGGGGGGMVAIFANIIYTGSNATASIIQAKGSNALTNGTNATAGNTGGGGGGAGGGGGCIYIVAGQRTGNTVTNALDVSGGNGSSGTNGFGTGTGGNGGGGGNGGTTQVINLSAGTFTISAFNTAGGAGGAHSGAAGGAGGAGAVVQGNL